MELDVLESEIGKLKTDCGIYCFIHRETLRCYIGQSTRIGVRFRQHLWHSSNGSLGCFHRAIRKYGIEKFDLEIIELCSPSELSERETFWIKFYDSASINGFNNNEFPGGTQYEKKMSGLTKQRISLSNTGKIRTPEAREKVRRFRLQYKVPESTRAKMREGAKRRKPITEETRQKLIAARKLFRHTEETKQKLRLIKTGIPKSPDTIEKLRLAGLGRKHSPKTLERMSVSALNRSPSPLRNQKLKEAWVARREKKMLASKLPLC